MTREEVSLLASMRKSAELMRTHTRRGVAERRGLDVETLAGFDQLLDSLIDGLGTLIEISTSRPCVATRTRSCGCGDCTAGIDLGDGQSAMDTEAGVTRDRVEEFDEFVKRHNIWITTTTHEVRHWVARIPTPHDTHDLYAFPSAGWRDGNTGLESFYWRSLSELIDWLLDEKNAPPVSPPSAPSAALSVESSPQGEA